jgi:hypothetical protein
MAAFILHQRHGDPPTNRFPTKLHNHIVVFGIIPVIFIGFFLLLLLLLLELLHFLHARKKVGVMEMQLPTPQSPRGAPISYCTPQ